VAFSWTAIVVFLSLIKSDNFGSLSYFNFQGKDKVLHAVSYCMLSFLWSVYVKNKYSNTYSFIIFTCCTSFGILMEFFQDRWTSTREFDNYDILANTIGVILGIMLFKFMKK
jgi:VanZ family protein